MLICIPPEIDETFSGIQEIIEIWTNETNNEYFYNQSRLVLEMAEKYPN